MDFKDLNYKKFLAGIGLAMVVFAGVAVLYSDDESTDDGINEFNRTDLMFMNMMIIHHDQAIEMAELSSTRTDNENILELSRNISEAQKAENQQMSEWLRELGYQRPRDGHRMAGMATQQEMIQLRQSEGREFDLLFSELMIDHHQGGIQMAKAEVQNGGSEKVKELAQGMVDAQTKEVEKMEAWSAEWRSET